MRKVVTDGTGKRARSKLYETCGKTGTAQNPHGAPHSWFVGFAPADDPEIVIAAVVEFGHPDNQVSQAVPFAIGLVERYLDSLYPEVPPPPRLAKVRSVLPAAGEETR